MLRIIQVDYDNPQHAAHMGYLLNQYALDPMGGGSALPGDITETLARELGKRPHAFTILCYVNDEPAGMVNCFELFSTFAGKPLINIHDVVVLKAFRGRDLARQMLDRVESIARERGCCKLTLEVLEGNHPAKSVYRRMGFAGYELDPAMGKAVFWQKPLTQNQ